MSSTTRQIISSAVRTRLAQIPTLVTKLTEDSIFKVFLKLAPGDANMPYVVIDHVYGGELARTPRFEFDQLWMVMAVSTNQPEAEEIDALMQDALVHYKLSFGENWQSWERITLSGSFAEQRAVQGQEVFRVGMYIRIRGTKGN